MWVYSVGVWELGVTVWGLLANWIEDCMDSNWI